MKGKITKIKIWASNLGCFIGIDNGGRDYLYNHVYRGSVGDFVEYDTGTPTDDGKPTLSKLVLIEPTVEAYVDEDKPRSAQVYRQHDQPQWQQEKDKERAKFRLDCVRIAAQVFEGAQKKAGLFELADDVENYARGEKA